MADIGSNSAEIAQIDVWSKSSKGGPPKCEGVDGREAGVRRQAGRFCNHPTRHTFGPLPWTWAPEIPACLGTPGVSCVPSRSAAQRSAWILEGGSRIAPAFAPARPQIDPRRCRLLGESTWLTHQAKRSVQPRPLRGPFAVVKEQKVDHPRRRVPVEVDMGGDSGVLVEDGPYRPLRPSDVGPISELLIRQEFCRHGHSVCLRALGLSRPGQTSARLARAGSQSPTRDLSAVSCSLVQLVRLAIK